MERDGGRNKTLKKYYKAKFIPQSCTGNDAAMPVSESTLVLPKTKIEKPLENAPRAQMGVR